MTANAFMTTKFWRSCFCALVLLWPAMSFPASFVLTNKQFTNRGDGAFIGQITGVQVLSSNKFSESGTVQLQITNVISGKIAGPNVVFSYQRALVPAVESSNWDLIKPLNVSLQQFGVGRTLLIYFETQSDGSILIAAAGNSVQDATDGLLLAKIESVNRHEPDKRDSHQQVRAEVVEVIFGWVNGTEISLPWDAQPGFNAHGQDLQGKEVVIVFDKSRIRGITPATSDFLAQLRQADMD
jgi:hypothetical protein